MVGFILNSVRLFNDMRYFSLAVTPNWGMQGTQSHSSSFHHVSISLCVDEPTVMVQTHQIRWRMSKDPVHFLRRAGDPARLLVMDTAGWVTLQLALNRVQMSGSSTAHQDRENQIKLSNKAVLIKYELRFCYCISYYSPQIFSETYVSVRLSRNVTQPPCWAKTRHRPPAGAFSGSVHPCQICVSVPWQGPRCISDQRKGFNTFVHFS